MILVHEFFRVEYEQCLSLLKHYDQRHDELVKFASGLSAAVPSALFAFRSVGANTVTYFWPCTALVAAVTCASLLSIFTALVQNRLYFTYVARQVNGIRGRMVADSGFDGNCMYTDSTMPAFSWLSTHTVLYIIVALQVGLFASVAMFASLRQSVILGVAILASSALGLSLSAGCIVVASRYLSARGAMCADEGVHGVSSKEFMG
jgi:hypothetical protein